MKNEYFTHKINLLTVQNASNQATQSGNNSLALQNEIQANAIRDRMDYLAGSIISDEIGTSNRPDTILKWLNYFDRIEAEFYIAQNLFVLNRYASADSVLQLIPTKFTLTPAQTLETSIMRQLVALLAGRDVFSLDEATKTALQTFAQKEFSHSGDWAKNVLHNYGFWFSPTYKLPTKTRERNETSKNSMYNNTSHLYPNPVQNLLHIDLSGTTGEGRLSLFNSTGNLITTYDVGVNDLSQTINVSNFSSGLYFVHVVRGTYHFTEQCFIRH